MEKAACYGGRRIHLRIDGLPGWLLGLITEAGPFKLEAHSYSSNRPDTSGPNSVLLGSTLVVSTTEPDPYVVPKTDDPSLPVQSVDTSQNGTRPR